LGENRRLLTTVLQENVLFSGQNASSSSSSFVDCRVGGTVRPLE
jgi:hypothetical protein